MADATAHRKFIAYSADAVPLFEKAGVAANLDEGFIPLAAEKDCKRFVAACRKLRFWDRENAER